MQGEARLAFDRDDRVRRRADEQHVALGEHRAAVLVVLRYAVPEPLDDLDAAVVILVEIRHRLPDPARLRLDDELGVVTVEAHVFRLVRARLALRQDPAAERHVDDGEQHERDADRRDAKDPERLLPARLEQVVHQEECRGAEDRERRAERRGERHRHQEPRGRQVLHPREPHHDRQHHRSDHDVVRERRERRDRGHHDEDHPPLTAARGARDAGADPLREAGLRQRRGDDEHRGDDDGGLARKSGERLARSQDARRRECEQRQHRRDVDADLLADEEDQRDGHDRDEDDLFLCHGRAGRNFTRAGATLYYPRR